MIFGTVEKPPRLSEFDLEIPEKLIAKNLKQNNLSRLGTTARCGIGSSPCTGKEGRCRSGWRGSRRLPSQRVPALVGHARRLARGLLSRPSRRAAASDELCNREE